MRSFIYGRTRCCRSVLPSGVVEIDDISFGASRSRFGAYASLVAFRYIRTYKVSIQGGDNFY